jgi:hypothetical protein
MSKDHSETALNIFIDYLGKKSLLNKETLRSRRTAAQRLLSVLDNEEKLDLSKVDIDHIAKRFAHHSGAHPRTLQDYQRRFKSLLTDFLAWTEDPVTFKPSVVSQGPRKRSSNRSAEVPEKTARLRGGQAKLSPESSPSLQSDKMLTVPISLRPGLVMQLVNVPVDLTGTEAERIAGIIKAYALQS